MRETSSPDSFNLEDDVVIVAKKSRQSVIESRDSEEVNDVESDDDRARASSAAYVYSLTKKRRQNMECLRSY